MNKRLVFWMIDLGALAAFAWLSGCGVSNGRGTPSSQSTPFDLAVPLSDDLATPSTSDFATGPDNVDPGDPMDCTDGAKLVYVVDENNTLSSFDPSLLAFHDIGTLTCPAQQDATPFSMGIDRNATAWVLYSSGELFSVDTTTAKCKATAFQIGQENVTTFGMGFVSNAVGSTDETLFVASTTGGIGNTNQLGTIDMKTLKLSIVGNLDGSPELTGNENAQLWGFFPDAVAPHVAQINKASGQEIKTFPLKTIAGDPSAWAFAHWGGDYWIFLERDGDASTSVYHFRPSIQQLTTPLPNTGRNIVGAGVSTCAPTTIS